MQSLKLRSSVAAFVLLLAGIASATTRQTSSSATQFFNVSPAVAAPGQFVHFDWRVNSTSFTVTPNMLSEEQTALPPSATNFVQVAPANTTTFRGIGGTALTTTLNVVPITLSATRTSVPAGQTVTLTFTGPNNGSSFFLVTLPEYSTVPLVADSCAGETCTGSYVTSALGSNRIFTVGATGPYKGQAYSQQVAVDVQGGMSLSCTATPVIPAAGQAVTIAWAATNAASVRIDQGIGNVSPATSGQVTVHPTQSTTYTCTATDRFGDHLSRRAKVILSTGDVNNLNHIVYMLQENRSFDNYFGNLAYYRVYVDQIPGAQMSDVNDLHNLPPGYMLQSPEGQSFPPFHARTECIEGLNPNWNETHTDMDVVGGNWLTLTSNSQYLMNDFLFTTGQAQYDPTKSRPLGYYDWTDLPFYYELATQFNTDDSLYSPVPDATDINRAYLFAGTSYGYVFAPGPGNWMWLRPTFFRRLQNAGISWRYYYQDNSVYLAQWGDWNNPQIQNNVRNIQEYYNILASDNADEELPQVVFIERASNTGYDEHPGNNVQLGAARVEQILDALLTSTAWPDSAFLFSYDEGGGLYDQQSPILVTQPDDQVPNPRESQTFTPGLFNVTGFRVPNIIVSPYSKPHTVFHQQTDYSAFLKLIETRFNLQPLTRRDATAADLTDPTNGPFDFSSPEMLQVPPLPVQPTNGTCNYQLESYGGQ